ncbi:putative Dynein heavy chain, N-terminal region 2 [Blattamonas nauphoetae]|uniref:Dynein heavy chain, N-terminal region 2 n=1 Tax=Blattamonas nauphoetae TaxID=2049346 RepID=A0ABQ9X732_9EUKA|nr:putative Dynein heavy chain, N-terminal region 2 [Blattamonas nauphoetae]
MRSLSIFFFYTTVVKLLRQNIDDFRPSVSLLNALCVPVMKPRHWKKLFTALGKQWTATLTLGQIMTMNLLQYAPQVMNISATAIGEYGLETQLEKIKKI